MVFVWTDPYTLIGRESGRGAFWAIPFDLNVRGTVGRALSQEACVSAGPQAEKLLEVSPLWKPLSLTSQPNTSVERGCLHKPLVVTPLCVFPLGVPHTIKINPLKCLGHSR